MYKPYLYRNDQKLHDSVRKCETLCNKVSLCVFIKGGEENRGCERKEIRQVLKKCRLPSCALSPSNPAGSRPSGGLMLCDISQHAAWIPGNDKYQPQLCTTISRDSCSHQSRPLDVSQDPRMFCIWQGRWTARVRRNMKWIGDILATLSLLHSAVLWCDMQMGGLHGEVCCRHIAVQSLQQMLLSFQSLSPTSVILCLNQSLCCVSLIHVNGHVQIWSCGATRC